MKAPPDPRASDELVVTPGPTSRHQWIVAKLLSRLFAFAEDHDLGKVLPAPLDVLFAPGDYVEPDIVFVRKDRSDLLTDRGVEGPPDLVVEIVSPSTARRRRGIKLDRYRLYGVPEYWVVDPDERTIEVWRLADGAESPVVHGSGGTMVWAPRSEGPVLEIALDDVLRD